MWGEQGRLAAALDIPQGRLSRILSRQMRCDPELAARIEALTNKQITLMDLLFRDRSKNPLLR